MIEKRILSVLCTLVIVLAHTIVDTPVYAQKVSQVVEIKAKDIEYTLAYPGILPDNPLYALKELRNGMWVFFTRDNLKKAELLLLFSDKKANAALLLSQKGKWDLAIESMTEGEKEFLYAVNAMRQAKKQGGAPTGDFVLKSKLSNEKHREIAEDLLKEAPGGQVSRIQSILSINKRAGRALEKL